MTHHMIPVPDQPKPKVKPFTKGHNRTPPEPQVMECVYCGRRDVTSWQHCGSEPK